MEITSYYMDEYQGLEGKWNLQLRMKGLEVLLDKAQDATILDVGAAEGLVALEFAKRGALYITGIEYDMKRVQKANEIFKAEKQEGFFIQGDLNNWQKIVDDNLIMSDPDCQTYDIVLFLGIFHHLNGASRVATTKRVLDTCNKYFAVRTPADFMPMLMEVVVSSGKFKRFNQSGGVKGTDLGNLVIFERK